MTSLGIHPEFWRKKRVLLTGHTGFKGGWLSLWLQAMGANVRGLALEPPTEPALFKVARVAAEMEHCIMDMRDFAGIADHMASFRPEVIFHLAAQPLVRESYRTPVETYATNIMGTVHVLEGARRTDSVRTIVNVTSDKCYENKGWVWGYREHDAMGGHDPYSSSKGCAELISSAYSRSFLKEAGIAIATARAGNVIGGGDWAQDRLVPDVLRALERQEAVQVRNPEAVRPWQHVLEPLGGYLMLAESLFEEGQMESEGWNFGPHEDDVQPVKWIAEHLCRMWGGKAFWARQSGSHPHEATYLRLDISKSRQQLGWRPRWRLKTALRQTVEWHKLWRAGEDMRDICLGQIASYCSVDSHGNREKIS